MNDLDLAGNPRPLIDALKRGLRREGITYAQLAQRMDLSEASIKRLFSQGRFSLRQVLQVCEAIGTDLGELYRGSRARAEMPRELGMAQERALADDPRLLLLFHLLTQNWTLDDIARSYGLKGPERTRLLAQLDRLRLIELLPQERIRLRVARDFAWRSNGPIRRRYGAQVLQEFLLDRFGGEHSLLRFQARELGEASIHVIHRKLERLALEVSELAELDASLPGERKRSVGVAVAMRPWVFSIANALKSGTALTGDAAAPPRKRSRVAAG